MRRTLKYRLYTSFTLKQAGWAYLGAGRVRIGKRQYRFVESRSITGQIKTVTIKRDRAGRLWILFSTLEAEVKTSPHEEVTHPVGLDFGLKTFLSLSDGTTVASPEFFKASILEWVCLKRGVRFVKVDRYFASTKICSDCGAKQDLSLSDRNWLCSSCGSVHDRDQNAAINICREGASSLGLGDVRPLGAFAARSQNPMCFSRGSMSSLFTNP